MEIKPQHAGDMTEQDNTTHLPPHTPSTALGYADAQDLLQKARSQSDVLRARGIVQEQDIPNFKPGIPIELYGDASRPGQRVQAAAQAPKFRVGQKVYHKLRKEEGKILELKASGMIKIRLDSGKEGNVKPEVLAGL